MEKSELACNLKKLVGGQSTDSPFLFEFTVDKAWNMICSYCNIDTVPDALETTLLSMCIDIYRTENYGSKEEKSSVKSISEGEASVSYASAYSSNPSSEFLKDYKSQLNKYRKVAW
ncbi:MAG: hypothetical protein VB119_07055 [Candidatus Metalachnospira sp.]|nr:hypothetical protein [Candidatus Metalachnospira sp.]